MKERNRQAGFSLIELLIVGSIILVLTATALVTVFPAMRTARADAGLQQVRTAMTTARQLAIDRRQVIRVTFTAPGTITTDARQPIVPPNPAVFANLATAQLPADVAFTVYPGFPNTVATTPDGFGTAIRAIDFAGTAVLYFQPDGSVQLANGTIANGVVYVARANQLGSARAVTLFGAAGRIKAWRISTGNGAPAWQY
jgi:prepilin-type N-terminal cleavage/methylation domain-containing protein